MKQSDRFIIKVPGSTANLGPGFDSIGLALNLYLTLEVQKSNTWDIIPLSKELEIFPKDEHHFIASIAIETARRFKKQMPPCQIHLTSEIPLARGLGSSASAIVAGIELANKVCSLHLTKQEKLEIASEIEGHPDNVGASIFGGLVIGSQINDHVDLLSFHDLHFDAVVVIPNNELLTMESREVLPTSLPYHKAVHAGAIGNMLVAALLSGNWELAGKMMKNDLYHQPYRRKLVPFYNQIEQNALAHGAFGVALSGAGPTVICFAEKEKTANLKARLSLQFPETMIAVFKIDQHGSYVGEYPNSNRKQA